MYRSLTIKARLVALLVFLSLMLTVIGATGIYGMSQSNRGLLDIHEHRTVPISLIGDLRALVLGSYMLAMDAVHDPAHDNIRANAAQISNNQQRAKRIWERYLAQDMSADEREIAETVETHRAQFMEVLQITESSMALAAESQQTAEGNTSLSQRTEEQASSLQQTASSMEQMTATVRQNAENADHANPLASTARQTAEKGGTVVADAVSAMNEINHSSRSSTSSPSRMPQRWKKPMHRVRCRPTWRAHCTSS